MHKINNNITNWLSLASAFGFLFVLVASIFFAMHSVSTAEAPALINYQGKLIESGQSVTTTKSMIFVIYNASTGGTALYSASGTVGTPLAVSVTPNQGIFSVTLGDTGSTNALDDTIIRDNDELYLEVRVDGTTLTPRKRLTSAAYAINSKYLLGVSATTTSSSTYIPISDSSGNFAFTGDPQSTLASGGVIYINPASADPNEILFGISVGGVERFKIDEDGDLFTSGTISFNGSLDIGSGDLDMAGIFTQTGTSTLSTTTISNLTISGSTSGISINDLSGTSTLAFLANSQTFTGANTFSATSTFDGATIFNGSVSGIDLSDLSGTTTLVFTDANNIFSVSNTFSATVNHNGEVIFNGNTSGIDLGDLTGTSTLVFTDANNIFTASTTFSATTSFNSDAIFNGNVSGIDLSDLSGTSTIAFTDESNTFSGTTTITNVLDTQGKIANPLFVSASSTNDAKDVKVVGDFAYFVSPGNDTFYVFDISDKSSPTLAGSLVNGTGGSELNNPQTLEVSGNYAYVVSFSGDSLEIIDISNPDNPVHAGSVSTVGSAGVLDGAAAVYVSGNYAYIGGTDTVAIVDISNPANPLILASLTDGTDGAELDNINGIFVQGNYAYATGYSSNSFEVIDISNPESITHVSAVSTTGSFQLDGAWGVYVQGKYAYISSFIDDALEIIDISDPTNLTHAGVLTDGTGGASLNGPVDIKIAGDYAYIVAQNAPGGLEIVDISDPTSPTHVGDLQDGDGGATLLSGALGLDVVGNYAYVASHLDNSLTIIDITGAKISNAEIGNAQISSLQVLSESIFDNGVKIRGGLDVGSSGLLLRGNFGMSGAATNTLSFSSTTEFITGGLAGDGFIFDTASTLSSGNILSVRNNGTEQIVLTAGGNFGINTSTPSTTLAVGGNFLATGTSTFVGGGAQFRNLGATSILDLGSQNLAASAAGIINLRGYSSLVPQFNLDYNNNNFFRIDAFTGPNRGRITLGGNTFRGQFRMLDEVDTTLVFFASTSTEDSYIINDFLIGNTTEAMTTSGFVMDGDDMYVHDFLGVGDSLFVENDIFVGTSSLHISSAIIDNTAGALQLNTTNNNNIITGSGNFGINTSSPQATLAVDGTFLVTGTSTWAGPIVQTGDLGTPTWIDSISDGAPVALSGAEQMYIQGDYAYITADGDNAIEIIDISDPSNLTHVGVVETTLTGGVRRGLYASGNYVYSTSQNDGDISVVDVSDPSHPVEIATSTGLLNGPHSLVVEGNYAYVAESFNSSFAVVDISDPYNMVRVGRLNNGAGIELSGASGVYIQGKYAYVTGNSDDGLEIIDITDPTNPTHVGSITDVTSTALDGARGVFVRGKYAYVTAETEGGLEIIDVSDPTNPTHVAAIFDDATTTLAGARDVVIAGNYAYVVALIDDGLEIIDISDPTAPLHVSELSPGATFNGAFDIVVKGGTVYLTASIANSFHSINVGASEISNTNIGNANIGNLRVDSFAQFNGGLTIRGGLEVGNSGLLLNGDFGMSGTTTHKMTFGTTTQFTTYAASSTGNIGFIFDAETLLNSGQYVLSVRAGGTAVFSVEGNGDVHALGTLSASSASVGTPGSPGDLAEQVDIRPEEVVEPGDIVIVDADATDRYRRSRFAYEKAVAGVISTNPTIVVGDGKTEHTAKMAMIGRVPIKVSSENGAIQHGDILVSGSLPGHAMKYDPNKDPGNMVGIIGIALESFSSSSSTGKIMGLVKTGWFSGKNKTITEMQQDIVSIAQVSGVDTKTRPQQLGVEETSGGQIGVINENLNLNGHYLVNVAGIVGNNNKWEVDTEGRFVTKVETSEGTAPLYALQSQSTEYIISGSGTLIAGEKHIEFDKKTQDIIDATTEIKVSITLTSEANGVFIKQKDEKGFLVKELQNGSSNASFDWVVIAKRNISSNSSEAVENVNLNIGAQRPIEESASATEPEPTPDVAEESATAESPTEEILVESLEPIVDSEPTAEVSPEPEVIVEPTPESISAPDSEPEVTPDDVVEEVALEEPLSEESTN